MSSVKIQGSATGTANFTIAVPDGTSTDRTIELPDAAGSFVTADASGNVGIGTTSPSAPLQVQGAAGEVRLQRPTSTQADWSLKLPSSGGELTFYDNNNTAERARIDSSGNLLVGTTDNTVYNNSGSGTGINLQNFGNIAVARDGNDCMALNRLNSDGDIIGLYRDGSIRGLLGNASTALYITNGATTGIKFGTNAFYATDGSGSNVDNSKDVGTSGVRFDDIYATSGVVNTSDANEKQSIASLTDEEITAAKAISKLFKTYKWNRSVEAKGDAARTHTGVIAQQVETAMTDAGLDAGNYAFFISSTWYEDADGNEVEADTEGAIERNRKGIRYPELLSFIGAATEQRLASIEARLDALEAV